MIKKCRNIAVLFAAFSLTSCGKIVPNTENLPQAVTTWITSETTSSQLTTAKEIITTSVSLTTAAVTTTSSTSASQPATTASQTAAAASAAPTTAATTAAATAAPETTAAPTEAAAETTTAETTEANKEAESILVLANKNHSIGEYVPPSLTALYDGAMVDSRIYQDLQDMYNEMWAEGYAPYTREGYRTYEDQKEIMETRINMHLNEGYSYDGAVAQAEKFVAEPGTSEHQLGLAVDINASDGNEWGLYYWLSIHAHEYGFILRYPQGKEYVTGYEYEPWHYRYVGKEAAEYIYYNGLTLEEYLGTY